MVYRQDINMLRAVAVIMVMLFHFAPNFLRGGFIGVDIFFVISGFLMTNIIISQIKQNKFSVIEFYLKRAYRIIPALFVLCLVLLVLGWFWLTPEEYRYQGRDVACSLAFVSNLIYFYYSNNYFATNVQEQWLIHSWSLAVEAQFYFLYPLFLVVLKKKSLRQIRYILLVITLVSFSIGIIASKLLPTAAYYLLPSRIWELLIGGMAYLYPMKIAKNNKIIFYLGLLLIIASSFIITKTSLWPGYLAIIPVFGTFLIIQAQYNNSRLVNNYSLQKIGTWSYSIYLYHWPLVVIIYLFALCNYWVYIAIPLAIFLGFLSYNYVENTRFNLTAKNTNNIFKVFPICGAVFLCTISSYIYFKKGKNYNYFLIPCVQQLWLNPLLCRHYF